MRTTFQRWLGLFLLGVLFSCAPHSLLAASDSLTWHQKENRVDADIASWSLLKVLETIAADTGWQVYVQPDTDRNVSVKFKSLSTGEALRSLLGNLNFAVVPRTNGPSRLYVFRTSQSQATRLIRAPAKPAKPIPNELIVTLKPGSKTKIEDLARLLGAKIVGRMDDKNAYRLQFEDEAAANAAREDLADNPDVQSVDSNYNVMRPPDVNYSPQSSGAGDLQLNPKSNDGNCQLVIGMPDTGMQPPPPNLTNFFLPTIRVVPGTPLNPAQVTHGTAMADTMLGVLGKVTGGSTSVKILPVDIYGNGESTTTFDVANGVVKAVNGGANVISLSLGSDGDSPFLHNILTQVSDRGIPIFAAAGNQPVTTPTYPAAYPEVVAVTASDRSGNLASYANRGSFIDMIAPGDTTFKYNNQTYFAQGTSAATAYASAMAAGLADKSHACADQALSLLRNSLKGPPTPGSTTQR
jgi:Subtilase family